MSNRSLLKIAHRLAIFAHKIEGGGDVAAAFDFKAYCARILVNFLFVAACYLVMALREWSSSGVSIRNIAFSAGCLQTAAFFLFCEISSASRRSKLRSLVQKVERINRGGSRRVALLEGAFLALLLLSVGAHAVFQENASVWTRISFVVGAGISTGSTTVAAFVYLNMLLVLVDNLEAINRKLSAFAGVEESRVEDVDLGEVLESQQRVCRLVRKINRVYGYQNVFYVAKVFICCIVNFVDIYLEFYANFPGDAFRIFFGFLWNFFHLAPLVVVFAVCESLTTEAENFMSLWSMASLLKNEGEGERGLEKAYLTTFKLKSNAVSITANNWFDMGIAQLYSMTGAFLTLLIIFSQFVSLQE